MADYEKDPFPTRRPPRTPFPPTRFDQMVREAHEGRKLAEELEWALARRLGLPPPTAPR